MKRKLILAAKIAVFIVGAAFSSLFFPYFWSCGAIFGVVVLVWHVQSLGQIFRPRSMTFLAASTLIYAIVIFFYMLGEDGDDPFPIFLYGAVLLGTCLLASAHAILLKVTWRRALIAIPITFASWVFFGQIPVRFINALGNSRVGDFIMSALYVPSWQAAYLLAMFCPPPKFLRREK